MRSLHRNTIFVLGLALYLTSFSLQASDRSMRCGGNLIHAGGGKDSALMYEVLKKCGEPEAKQGNTWIYKHGTTYRALTFNHEGRVQLIESSKG